jgi:ribosomal protein L16 Arg81 hydroxylase
MKTGDAIILPPMYSHKSVPLGPRVTLSLGGLPKQHSH